MCDLLVGVISVHDSPKSVEWKTSHVLTSELMLLMTFSKYACLPSGFLTEKDCVQSRHRDYFQRLTKNGWLLWCLLTISPTSLNVNDRDLVFVPTNTVFSIAATEKTSLSTSSIVKWCPLLTRICRPENRPLSRSATYTTSSVITNPMTRPSGRAPSFVHVSPLSFDSKYAVSGKSQDRGCRFFLLLVFRSCLQ